MSTGGYTPFRRRKFFIKKGFQGRFIAAFACAVLAGFFLNMGLAYFLIDRELAEGLYRIHLKVRTTSEIAGPILWKLGFITIPVILAASALAGWYLTRRVEIPLLSFRKSIEKIGQGDFAQRLTGEVPDVLPEVFNSMTGSLEARFASVREASESLDEGFSARAARLDTSGPERRELEAMVREVAEARSRLNAELGSLRL